MIVTLARKLLITSLVIVALASAQTQVDLQHQARGIDFTSSSYTKPIRMGSSLPATCAVGEVYMLTTATAGANLYTCLQTNQWTVQGAGGVPLGTAASQPSSAFDPAGAAASALSAAQTYASNAGNLTSGTIGSALLPAASSTAAGAVQLAAGQTTSVLAAVATTGAYSNLSGTPAALPPNGSAGGDLGGTYPAPTVSKINGAGLPPAGSLTKVNSSSQLVAAVSGTDYAPATTGTSGQVPVVNGAGGFGTPVSPAINSGSGINVSGTWPTWTITNTGAAGSMAIGGAVTGSSATAIPFIGTSNTLSQDVTHFYFNPGTYQLTAVGGFSSGSGGAFQASGGTEATPSTPGSGMIAWFGSSSLTLEAINSAGNVSTTVFPSTCGSNQFGNAISAGGVFGCSPIASTQLSDTSSLVYLSGSQTISGTKSITGSVSPSGAGVVNANQVNGGTVAGTSGDIATFGAGNTLADGGFAASDVARLSQPQTVTGNRTFTAAVDASGATHTKPAVVVATSAALPAGCATGELGFVSGSTAGQNIWECNGGTWTQQLNSGGSGNLPSGCASTNLAYYNGSSWTCLTLGTNLSVTSSTLNASGSGSGTVTSVSAPPQFATASPTTAAAITYPALPNAYTQDQNSPYLQNLGIRRTSYVMTNGNAGFTSVGESQGTTGTAAHVQATNTNPYMTGVNIASGSSVGVLSANSIHRTARTHGMRLTCGAVGQSGGGASLVTARTIPCGLTSTSLASSIGADVPGAYNMVYIVSSTTGAYTSGTDTTHWMLCTVDGTTQNCASTGLAADQNYHTFELFEDLANSRWCAWVDGANNVCLTTHLPAAHTNLAILSGSNGIGAAAGQWQLAYAYVVEDWK